MGLLDHLWDDTVAGPRPDGALRKLRNRVSSTLTVPLVTTGAIPVTRSITILRSTPSISSDSESLPLTPTSDPDSPITPTTPSPRPDWRSLRRKKAAENVEAAEPRSPTVYDWVVISSMDR